MSYNPQGQETKCSSDPIFFYVRDENLWQKLKKKQLLSSLNI